MNNFNEIIKAKLGAFPIGAWLPYYKKDLNADYLKGVRESGINFIPTTDCGKEELDLVLSSGLKALVNDDRVTYSNITGINRVGEWTGEYADKEGVIGVFVWDEPSPAMMDICGAINKQVQLYHENIFGYINLHPNYSDRVSQRDGLSYEDYLQYFVDHCSPKLLSFDHYPFFEDGFHAREYLDNLAAVRKCCDKNKLEFWSFIQSTSFGKNPPPTEGQMNFRVHSNIAYGAKGLLYFTYSQVVHEQGFGSALLDKEFRRTQLYEYAKKINAGIEKIGTRLLELKPLGVKFFGERYLDYSTAEADFSLSGGNFLAGLFLEAGKRCAYLVNLDLEKGAAARLSSKRGEKEILLSPGGGCLVDTE